MELIADLGVKQELQFTILGRPQQRGSKQAGLIPKRGGGWVEKNGRPIVAARDDNTKSKDWMQEVRSAAFMALNRTGNRLMMGPIELTARFFFIRPKSHYRSGKFSHMLKPDAPEIHAQSPDLAKLVRCLEDSLSGLVWQDDKLVFRYGKGTQRYWATDYERCEVEIVEYV